MIYDNKTTKEDFKALFGVDLDVELGAMPNDTGDKPSGRMINMVEEFLKMYFSSNGYTWDGNVETINARQLKCFKHAVCWQIDYILVSGTINQSGFTMDKGQMITPDQLRKLGVGMFAESWMHKGGLANLC